MQNSCVIYCVPVYGIEQQHKNILSTPSKRYFWFWKVPAKLKLRLRIQSLIFQWTISWMGIGIKNPAQFNKNQNK